MPIHAPGHRPRYRKIFGKGGKRKLVAILSLTAMVDMFTVLTVFLLQNFNISGHVLEIPKGVELPPASQIKELKPAHLVIVTKDFIQFNESKVAKTDEVKQQTKWMIPKLYSNVKTAIEKKKAENEGKIFNKIKNVVADAKKSPEAEDKTAYRKVTVEVDKTIDFETVKKVMFTITEAGGGEMNFAVVKVPAED